MAQSATTLPTKPTSSFVAPANIFWKPMPTPSMTASRIAQLIAPFLAALYPPRMASAPPVKKPAICLSLGFYPHEAGDGSLAIALYLP